MYRMWYVYIKIISSLEINQGNQMTFLKLVTALLSHHILDSYITFCFLFFFFKYTDQKSQFLLILYSSWTIPFMVQIVSHKLLNKYKMKDHITHIHQLT